MKPNKWQKIISETSISNPSDSQLFWRSIALLRLGQSKKALHVFESIHPKATKKLEFKLHLSELYLKNHQITPSQEILLDTFHECLSKTNLIQQWQFIANRHKTPCSQLHALLKRVDSQKESSEPHFNSWEEWLKGKKLKNIQSHPNFYLNWLTWCIKTSSSGEQKERVTEMAMHAHSQQPFILQQILKKSKDHINWNFLIDSFFPIQHKVQTQPDLMWNYWWRNCPSHSQKQLGNKMKDILEKYPNQKLENLLNQLQLTQG